MGNQNYVAFVLFFWFIRGFYFTLRLLLFLLHSVYTKSLLTLCLAIAITVINLIMSIFIKIHFVSLALQALQSRLIGVLILFFSFVCWYYCFPRHPVQIIIHSSHRGIVYGTFSLFKLLLLLLLCANRAASGQMHGMSVYVRGTLCKLRRNIGHNSRTA